MVKKEVSAIIVALLLVGTLGAGAASASGVEVGGGYKGSIDDFFTTDLWNGSFWDYAAGAEVEAVKNAREAREAREVNETVEENDSFWRSVDKTPWPAGYWDVDPRYGRAYLWPDSQKYWDVIYGFPWPLP